MQRQVKLIRQQLSSLNSANIILTTEARQANNSYQKVLDCHLYVTVWTSLKVQTADKQSKLAELKVGLFCSVESLRTTHDHSKGYYEG